MAHNTLHVILQVCAVRPTFNACRKNITGVKTVTGLHMSIQKLTVALSRDASSGMSTVVWEGGR